MTVTQEIEDAIAEAKGNVRDALNIALARLRQARSERDAARAQCELLRAVQAQMSLCTAEEGGE